MFGGNRIGVVYDSKLFDIHKVAREKNLLNPLYIKHKENFERVKNYLQGKEYKLESIDTAESRNLKKFRKRRIKVLIVSDLSSAKDELIRGIEIFLGRGGIVFTAYPSFCFGPILLKGEELEPPLELLLQRLRYFFGVSEIAEKAIEGKLMISSYSEEGNWVRSLPKNLEFKGNALLAFDSTFRGKVTLYVNNAKEIDDKKPKRILQERREFYTFLTRDYPKGGLLIYCCIPYFEIFEQEGIGSLMDAIIQLSKSKNIPKPESKLAEVYETRLKKIETKQKWHSLFIQVIFAGVLFLVIAQQNGLNLYYWAGAMDVSPVRGRMVVAAFGRKA